MSREVLLDLTFLTEEERDLISNVLSKDAEVRKQEQNRINTLRKELDRLKEDGLPEDELESKNDNYCARCQTYFGIVFNRGAFCPRCELKVCKICRINDIDVGWICTLCHKVREVKAQSGAWFFQGHKEKNGKLFGSMLVRQSLRRLPGSWSPPQKHEEGPTRYVSPKKDYDELNTFVVVNHARSPERSPRQPDKNSNQAQRGGGHQMGYQYSDESDVQSEQGSHDASVEDNHDLDTASERSPSKGESDGSESLDSDQDETATNDVNKFCPVASCVKEESFRVNPAVACEEELQGGLVQQGTPEGTIDGNSVPDDVRSGAQSTVEVAYMTQQSGYNRARLSGSIEETKDDEEIFEDTRKPGSRPSSLSLGEDISYVSAPMFDIPMKRRKYSDGKDPALNLGKQKSLSKSEEYLQEIGKKIQQEPSTELVGFTDTGSEVKEHKIADVHENKFDKKKEVSACYVFEGTENVGESFIKHTIDDITPKIDTESLDDLYLGYSVHEGDVHKESQFVVQNSFEMLCENSSAAQYSGKLGNSETVVYKESEVVVESSPDLEKPNNEQLNIRNDSFSKKDIELSVTDDFGGTNYDINSENSDSQKESPIDLLKDVVTEGDDSENMEVLSVLSRVRNWERKSTGDGELDQARSTRDIKRLEIPKSRDNRSDKFEGKVISYKSVVEELKKNNDKSSLLTNNDGTVAEGEKKDVDFEDKEIADLYEVSPEARVQEKSSTSEVKKYIQVNKVEDVSSMASTSIADQASVLVDKPNSVNELTRGDENTHEDDGHVYKERATAIESLLETDDSKDINKDFSLNEVESGVDPVTTSNVLETSETEYDDNNDVSPDIISSSDAMETDIPIEDITSPKDDVKAENSEIDIIETPVKDLSEYKHVDSGANHELSSGINNLALSSSNTDSSFGGNLTSSLLKSDTFVDTDAVSTPAQYEQEEVGGDYFDLKMDAQMADDETETPREAEASPVQEILEPRQDTRPKTDEVEPYSSKANVGQPAHEEELDSFDSRESALRAFSETFVSANLVLKRSESREGPDARDDPDSDEKQDADTELDTEQNREDQGNLEERGYLEDRGSEAAVEDREYLEGHENREDRGIPWGLENQNAGEGSDSRRSSDLHYEGFHADNESMISETSGYGTPTASEETSSKQTPSISGDEGMNSPAGNASLRRQSSETTPVIVTTDVSEDNVARRQRQERNRDSFISDFDDDPDVSFSKYGGGLGNRMLKDQLSMGSRESIVSYYSNAGGEVYGKYPVSGEVMFGIKYDPKLQEFQIQVHQARDITAVDKKSNTSDPYVKTYLLPDRSRTGKRKSKVKRHTVNPVFDEILAYKISYDEILQRTLWLAVWNHDTFGHNDFLGEVLVPIDQYHQSGFSLEDPEPQWHELCERQADDPQFSYNGEIVFSLKYVPPSALVSSKKKKKKKKAEEEKGELHVNIIEASNLLAKDANGFSDPFCKSYLLPDKSKKGKQKTPVIKKSLNPKWNYHFVYDNVTHEELMDRVLELTIWDFDRGSSNEFLGGVRLGLGAGLKEWDDANSEEQAAWNKMLNNQNDWNQVTLTLRDHMGSHKHEITN